MAASPLSVATYVNNFRLLTITRPHERELVVKGKIEN